MSSIASRPWPGARAWLVVWAWALTGCISAPVYRPVAPPFLEGQSVEAGFGAHAMFGQEEAGAGAGTWVHARVAPDVELVLRGQGTHISRYDGRTPLFGDVLAGGSVGLRGRYNLMPTLVAGGELLVDYQARTGGNGEQLLSGIFGIPVAEEAMEGLWFYTNILLGISVPLQPNPEVPMFGFQEIPLGVVWRPAPWLLLVAEGGVALPINGGYAGAAAALRF